MTRDANDVLREEGAAAVRGMQDDAKPFNPQLARLVEKPRPARSRLRPSFADARVIAQRFNLSALFQLRF